MIINNNYNKKMINYKLKKYIINNYYNKKKNYLIITIN